MVNSIIKNTKIKALFILFFSVFSSILAQEDIYSTTWLISIKETGNDRKFFFGMKNFINSRESEIFSQGHLRIRNPFFIVAFNRNQAGTINSPVYNQTSDHLSQISKININITSYPLTYLLLMGFFMF